VPRLEALEDRSVPSFVFQTLDDPNAGTAAGPPPLGTEPQAINARGQIVGFYTDAGGFIHGFLRSHGQYTTHPRFARGR
jgi:probable HAF family extracellular repeat protein